MSRLTQPAIVDGDAIDAASLNDRFSQYSQAGAINATNTRDAAFDLPQMKGTNDNWVLPQMEIAQIGHNDWKHGAYQTHIGQASGFHTVDDSVGTENGYLSFGPTGMTLNPDTHILRVYWNLQVRPRWEEDATWGNRPWSATGLNGSQFLFPFGGGGSTAVWDWFGCWAFRLQWDITDNTLTNWQEVPNQGDFDTLTPDLYTGEKLDNCRSTSVVPFTTESYDLPDNGNGVLNFVGPFQGWTAVDGAWHYARKLPAGALTVYGVRLVFTGPLQAYQDGTDNYLNRCAPFLVNLARIDQQAGVLQACKMRIR